MLFYWKSITNNHSQCLQCFSLSAVESQEIAANVIKILRAKRTGENFDKLWDELLQEKEKHQVINEATLPRRRKMPLPYDTPNHHYHTDPKLLHFVVVRIKERFNQPDY